MSMPCRIWIFFFCFSLPVFAQQTTSPSAQTTGLPVPAAVSNSTPQTTVDVVVTDKGGKPVSGLEKQDFSLLDNKKPEEIASFQPVSGTTTANPPVKVIVLVDAVNASYQTLSTERQQLEKFLAQNGGNLPFPVSIAFFSDAGINIQPTASRDGKTELAFLDQNQTALRAVNNAQGVAGNFDRISRSLRALRTVATDNLNTPGRKLLLWVSPGWPIPPTPAIDLGSKEKQNVFDTIVAVSGLLRVARITVYSIDPIGTADAGGFNSNLYRQYLNEIKEAGQSEVGNLALQVIATQSGGRVLVGSNDLSGELTSCIEDANAYYMLTFDPPHADHPNAYHRLEVKINKSGLKVRTLTTYYTQP
jgi:VWFA-related protein